MYLRNIYI